MNSGCNALILGLDGATWDIVLPMIEAGELSNLSSLKKGGAWGYLNSTQPPMTLPSWSSMLTGCNPGKHGIFDFTHKTKDSWDLEYINSTHRKVPTLHRILSDRGARVASIAVPTTWPPENLNGVVVSRFDSPVSTGIDESFCAPKSIYNEIQSRFGGLCFADFQESRIDEQWHIRAREALLKELQRKESIASWLLQQERWDCFMFLFGESDTASHHFWMFHDEDSPRFKKSDPLLHSTIKDVYRKLDQIVGKLIDEAQPKWVVLCSDHGFGGAGTHVLYLNRFLEEKGWLTYRKRARLFQSIDRGKVLAAQWLPSHIQGALFRGASDVLGKIEKQSRYGGIYFEKTKVLSDELNYAATLRLNGCRLDELEELREDLLSWEVEGHKVIADIHHRESLYWGSATSISPELILELNLREGYSYTLLPSTRSSQSWRTLNPNEYMGGKGLGMNGSHRQLGLLSIYGQEVPIQQIQGAQMWDIAPTLLHLMGEAIPNHMDGELLFESNREPTFMESSCEQSSEYLFEADETELLKKRLEKLGYL